jgi:hypothetical protein
MRDDGAMPSQEPSEPDAAHGDSSSDRADRLAALQTVDLPDWTGTFLLAWFPGSVIAAAIVGALQGRSASLLVLAALLLGFFLVCDWWIRGRRSLLLSLASAFLATAGTVILLVGVAALGQMVDDDVENSFARAETHSDQPVSQLELEGGSLRDANLRGVEVSGLDLSRRDLQGAELQGAVAVRAQFVRAWLPRASLRGADLTGADFTGACLTGADLVGANLLGADFLGADVEGVRVQAVAQSQAAYWPSARESAESDACRRSPEG